MSAQNQVTFVDTTTRVVELVEVITSLGATTTPSLYLDLEGINLSRNGSISIIAIFVSPTKHSYLVDVHTLGAAAFTTASASGTTLKSILESRTITKVFFDVRNDSDALHAHYGIRLQGIEDVQLMENAARTPGRRRFVSGLARTISGYLPLGFQQQRQWNEVKDKGRRRFAPEAGGSYAVFNERPLGADMVQYCVNDVQYLPQLRAMFVGRLGARMWEQVQLETGKRVLESQSAGYDPHTREKAFGPWERTAARYF